MTIHENNIIRINNVRLSFPSIANPKASTQGGQLRFRATALIPYQDPQLQELQKLIWDVAYAEWGNQAGNVLNLINADKRLRCYGQGETKLSGETGEPFDGYPGNFYIEGLAEQRPTLYDENLILIDPMSMGSRFIGGDYCDFVFRVWAQNNASGRGIRAEILGLRFVREGEHFGAPRADVGAIFGAPPQGTATAPQQPQVQGFGQPQAQVNPQGPGLYGAPAGLQQAPAGQPGPFPGAAPAAPAPGPGMMGAPSQGPQLAPPANMQPQHAAQMQFNQPPAGGPGNVWGPSQGAGGAPTGQPADASQGPTASPGTTSPSNPFPNLM